MCLKISEIFREYGAETFAWNAVTISLTNSFVFFSKKTYTAQKSFSIKYFFSKCSQISRKLRIWLHLLKKSLMDNFIFCFDHPLWCNTVKQTREWQRTNCSKEILLVYNLIKRCYFWFGFRLLYWKHPNLLIFNQVSS